MVMMANPTTTVFKNLVVKNREMFCSNCGKWVKIMIKDSKKDFVGFYHGRQIYYAYCVECGNHFSKTAWGLSIVII